MTACFFFLIAFGKFGVTIQQNAGGAGQRAKKQQYFQRIDYFNSKYLLIFCLHNPLLHALSPLLSSYNLDCFTKISTTMTNEEAYLKVQKKVKAKKVFYLHLGIYVIIIIFLAFMNWATNDHIDDDWWVVFPAVSWGTVLAIHALGVFLFSGDGLFGEEWEAKKIEDELAKRGYSSDRQPLPAADEIDINEHLDLKEVEKQTRYNEQDLV